jgi:3-keto-5-aminohexanoate cleavage enzyme
MKKLIINFTPTGMIPTKEMTKFVPTSPEEIIADVLDCTDLGISMVHLHARSENGEPSYQKETFRQIIEGIREKNKDIVIIASTSGRKFNEFSKRSEVLELKGTLKPDMASLTLSSVNFNKIASINSPDMIIRLAEKMMENSIKPELEIFDVGMVNFANYLIKKDLIKPPYFFNIILGNIASAQANLMHLGLIVSELPQDSYWSCGGVGIYQSQMNALGVVMADGVRVGLEDNIWYDDDRTELATNRALVERVVKIAKAVGRPIARPSDVRQFLDLDSI